MYNTFSAMYKTSGNKLKTSWITKKIEKMKNIELIFIIKIYLHYSRLYLCTPYTVQGSTIVPKKMFRLLFGITTIATYIWIGHFFGFVIRPDTIYSDPYYFLGFLRGSFITFCCFINGICIFRGLDIVPEIWNKLIELQSEIKFSQKQLRKILMVTMLEITVLYVYWFQMIEHLHQSANFGNIYQRLITAFSVAQIFSSEIYTELCIVNVVSAIALYTHMITEEMNQTVPDVNSLTVRPFK